MESRPDQCCVCVPSTCMSVCVWSLVWTDVCIIYTYVDDNCMPCNPCYHVGSISSAFSLVLKTVI